MAKEPSIDSPPKKRKRESKLSKIYEADKENAAKKKGKSKGKAQVEGKDGLRKCAVDLVGHKRTSPSGVDFFLLAVKGLKSKVWVKEENLTSDSLHCWLSGNEEAGED